MHRKQTKPITAAAVTALELASIRDMMEKYPAKIRGGSLSIINTTTLTVSAVSTIEVWHKKTRRYLPLAFKKGWRFTTPEERDTVLARLTKYAALPRPSNFGKGRTVY